AELPEGEWKAESTIQTGSKLISRIMVTLKKSGDSLIFDFTGTDEQAKVGINLPYHATFGSC
ncbi:MAG: hypothetical protein GTO40_16425, partial [Deltaproteobacteria bacterium]|nr:hypothetical protein [Deltaproteobacteria bacterium]